MFTLAFSFGVMLYITNQPWVDLSLLNIDQRGKPSILLDINGIEWGRFQLDKRERISFDKIPQHVVNAFIAAEDWDFFNHGGISPKAIARSLLINIYKGKRAQGASTITQQLVRLIFFDSQKSLQRKVKEQLLALAVEQQFSKEQILEAYLNNVYLGAGIYGIKAACHRFWSIDLDNISIEQAATLASIVQSPSKFCILNNLESCKKRRNLILSRMEKLGFIDYSTFLKASEKEINVNPPINQELAPYLKETIRLFLEKKLGKKQLYLEGLKIQTTLDKNLQEKAEAVFSDAIEKYRKNITPNLNGALLSLDCITGEIRALVGGYSFSNSQFNRAFHAQRQLGSIFKPIIYAQALAQGRKFTDIEDDEPLTIKINNQIWEPRNSYRFFSGSMTLAKALSYSNNIIPIKLFLEIGPEKIIKLAKKCGLQGPFNPYPSLALGCVDTTLEQATAMINVFANQGTYCKPHYLLWVKDKWGTKIWKNNSEKKQVILPFIAKQVSQVLTATVQRYKNKQPNLWFKFPAFGKTGTTNDARTCWFVGSNYSYTTGVYLGRDDCQPLGDKVYASQTVLPIWRDFLLT